MNKEQILQKFDEILENYGYNFFKDGVLETTYLTKSDLLELFEEGFNLGLEMSADNAEADYTILSEDAEYLFGQMSSGQDYEVYVLKNSILKFKL